MNTNNVGSSGGSGAPPMPKLKAVPVQTHKKVFEMNNPPQYSKVTGKGGASLVVEDKGKKDHLTLTGPRKEQLDSIRQPSGPLLTSIHSSRHDNNGGNEFNLFTH